MIKVKNIKKIAIVLFTVVLIVSCFSVSAFAAEGDVSGAVEDTWIAARGQIKSVTTRSYSP